MKIVIATPLYPPDVAAPAPYVKELARRLSEKHSVTLLAYGDYPEKLPGVTFHTVSKKRPRSIRLLSYVRALITEASTADVLIVINGASVELPASIVTFLNRTPLVLTLGDTRAHQKTQLHPFLRHIENYLQKKAHAVITHIPNTRPEQNPFADMDEETFKAYEASWQEHLAILEKSLPYDKQ